MTSIVFDNVVFGYDEKIILDGINLKMDGSGLICILGPNGVGKTTLAKCINKLLKPVSGCVYMNGINVQSMRFLDIAKKLAFVPNSSNSVFSVSVSETILMGRHPHAGWITSDKDIDAVDRVIELLELEDYADRDVRSLSAGQMQRVMIARGLVQEPEILILDEPTSNLDVKYQMDVMRFLKSYARDKGILVIMVCHDLNITAAYADRVVLMYDGKIFSDGSPMDVLTESNIKTVYDVNAKMIEINNLPYIVLIP